MKRFIVKFSLAVLVLAIAAPTLLAQSKDDKVIRRIVVRDGEVTHMGGAEHPDVRIFQRDGVHGPQTYLGVHAIDISTDLRNHFGANQDRGVLVSSVGENTPAAKAGIRAGDVIVSVDGQPVTSAGKLRSLIRQIESGKSTEVEVIRNGTRQKLFATLEQREIKAPSVHVWEDGPQGRVFLEKSEEGMRKLHEFFESPEWHERAMKLQDCGETHSKLEKVQKRLDELEKKLQKLQ